MQIECKPVKQNVEFTLSTATPLRREFAETIESGGTLNLLDIDLRAATQFPYVERQVPFAHHFYGTSSDFYEQNIIARSVLRFEPPSTLPHLRQPHRHSVSVQRIDFKPRPLRHQYYHYITCARTL